ncbi:MAG: acetyl-CoA carboxylase biotin carboxyl carrier protein [Pseudomonadota bacterium]|nr:acetyl-CoA carboxylase biotin carboxyl carrier protein [Pseudomonadota bacterium]MEE3288253.1 acetyl-CoA carboxylase biotin carboxyl carrier protein [Pseudomonadota bacterium]
MDIRKVKKLIELLEESGLTELEISEGEESVRLSRSGTATAAQSHPLVDLPAPELPVLLAQDNQEQQPTLDTIAVISPMVGTYYAAANPDSEPYVTLGSEVNVGDTLCVIEAMKIFNQVETETSGIVRKILKRSGDPVEYGETLFLIESDDP